MSNPPNTPDTGWRTIETAPKDGTALLVAWRQVEQAGAAPIWCQAVALYDSAFAIDGWDDDGDKAVYRAAWTDYAVASFNYEEYRELSPSHYRLLPPPPGPEEE